MNNNQQQWTDYQPWSMRINLKSSCCHLSTAFIIQGHHCQSIPLPLPLLQTFIIFILVYHYYSATCRCTSNISSLSNFASWHWLIHVKRIHIRYHMLDRQLCMLYHQRLDYCYSKFESSSCHVCNGNIIGNVVQQQAAVSQPEILYPLYWHYAYRVKTTIHQKRVPRNQKRISKMIPPLPSMKTISSQSFNRIILDLIHHHWRIRSTIISGIVRWRQELCGVDGIGMNMVQCVDNLVTYRVCLLCSIVWKV